VRQGRAAAPDDAELERHRVLLAACSRQRPLGCPLLGQGRGERTLVGALLRQLLHRLLDAPPRVRQLPLQALDLRAAQGRA